MLQPTVFDLSVTEIAALRQKIFGMLKLINGQETSPEAQDALRASLAEKLATPVSSDLLAQWMSPEVQEYVLSTGLPWFEDRLREGVVGDVRLALPSKNGIIVRDVDTKAETLRPDVSDIRDVPAVLAAFTQKLRSAEKLTPQGRRAVLVLFSPLIMPTLTLNREATQALGNAVAQTVEPVYYHIQKGEVVVYQGERVTREKQLKLQSLYQKQEGLIRAPPCGKRTFCSSRCCCSSSASRRKAPTCSWARSSSRRTSPSSSTSSPWRAPRGCARSSSRPGAIAWWAC